MPRPLTRNETAARVAALREVLTILWDVTAMTGGEPFATVGRAKVELVQLEADLRAFDRPTAPTRHPQPVAVEA